MELLPHQWITIPPDVRATFANFCGIKASSVGSVVLGGNAKVINDGFTAEDLKPITREQVLEFLGIEDKKQKDEVLLSKLVAYKVQTEEPKKPTYNE